MSDDKTTPEPMDLTGWDQVEKQPPSLEGQQALPGMEGAERERARRSLTAAQRRAESEGQQHLF